MVACSIYRVLSSPFVRFFCLFLFDKGARLSACEPSARRLPARYFASGAMPFFLLSLLLKRFKLLAFFLWVGLILGNVNYAARQSFLDGVNSGIPIPPFVAGLFSVFSGING